MPVIMGENTELQEEGGEQSSTHDIQSAPEEEPVIHDAAIASPTDTDKANVSLETMKSRQKVLVLKNGPCQPKEPFPEHPTSKRSFAES